MRKRILTVLLIAGLSVAGTGLVQAAGFNIYEAGVRATALGGAFTATADDGSALFYNPAGLSFMEGSSVNLNLMSIAPRFEFAQAESDATALPATGEAAENTFFIPGLYYTNNPGGNISYGIGLYAPFGLGVEWQNPEEWIGNQVSYDTSIETVYITPAVSYKVSPKLAISLGLDVAHQKLELNKFLPEPTLGQEAIDLKVDGSSNLNITPTLGLMYKPNEKLTFGVMYHHKKTMDYEDQDATFTNVLDPTNDQYSWPVNLLAGIGGSDQKISSEFNLPYILSFGMNYKFCSRFNAELNYVRFGWDHFESLVMDFTNDDLDQTIHMGYEDTWQVRFGATYDFKPDKVKLMAGYVYDNTPQPLESVSPLLPDSDRNDFSFGAEVKMNPSWDLLFSYMAVLADERTNIEDGQPANDDPAYPVGTYKSVANIFGMGVTYHF